MDYHGGLSEVIQIQGGILLSSNNNSFSEVESTLGDNIHMIGLCCITFGVTGTHTLRQRVIAGLEFYVLLAEQMSNVWQSDDIGIIEYSVDQICHFVSNLFSENILSQ